MLPFGRAEKHTGFFGNPVVEWICDLALAVGVKTRWWLGNTSRRIGVLRWARRWVQVVVYMCEGGLCGHSGECFQLRQSGALLGSLVPSTRPGGGPWKCRGLLTNLLQSGILPLIQRLHKKSQKVARRSIFRAFFTASFCRDLR